MSAMEASELTNRLRLPPAGAFFQNPTVRLVVEVVVLPPLVWVQRKSLVPGAPHHCPVEAVAQKLAALAELAARELVVRHQMLLR